MKNDRFIAAPTQENDLTNRHIAFIIKDQNPLMMHVDQTVQHACQAMFERRVGAVLIIDDTQKLQGIFTGRDATRAVATYRQSSWSMP